MVDIVLWVSLLLHRCLLIFHPLPSVCPFFIIGDYYCFAVVVYSKHNDDVQYRWESSAGGTFTVTEDHEAAPIKVSALDRVCVIDWDHEAAPIKVSALDRVVLV